MGQGIELIVANDATVALHIVEETEDIVDEILLFARIFFQGEKAGIEIFNIFNGFVDEVFEVIFAKGFKRIGIKGRKRSNPFLGS